MQHKDTSQQAFLIIYLMYFIIYLFFTHMFSQTCIHFFLVLNTK